MFSRWIFGSFQGGMVFGYLTLLALGFASDEFRKGFVDALCAGERDFEDFLGVDKPEALG